MIFLLACCFYLFTLVVIYSLGDKFERMKMFVPTRAHPSAPNKPPFETLVGLLTMPVDKLRDLFKDFPKTE
jgi:hypothetical protein